MPANNKYLTTSGWHRFAKITAGLLGGYLISALLHMSLALWLPFHRAVLITSIFSLYIVWGACMLFAFLAKSGWKLWGIYLLIILFLGITVYFGQSLHPLTDS